MKVQEAPSKETALSPQKQVRYYKSLLRIRRTEEICADEYRTGTMRTPTHFGIGQEGVAVGVCEALGKEDIAATLTTSPRAATCWA
jgi:TPP-dependent pyruvate/acetoin dehydrogenase alpha subunit